MPPVLEAGPSAMSILFVYLQSAAFLSGALLRPATTPKCNEAFFISDKITSHANTSTLQVSRRYITPLARLIGLPISKNLLVVKYWPAFVNSTFLLHSLFFFELPLGLCSKNIKYACRSRKMHDMWVNQSKNLQNKQVRKKKWRTPFLHKFL